MKENSQRNAVVWRMLIGRVGVARLAAVVAALLFWEVAARYRVDPQFLSPPSRIVLAMPSLFETPGVPAALWTAFWEFGVAFVIAVAIGLPQIVILPLLVLWLGIGPLSKITFGASHGVFPISIAVVAGVQNIQPILMVAAQSMGARRWQIFRWVIFPHMIPSFFAGMRLGMAGVLLGVLLAELYVSAAGIGYFTLMFTQSFDPSRLLGLIAVLAVMAIALNVALRRAELHFARWRTD